MASCNPETANEETQTLSQQSPIFACSVIIAALLAFFSFFFLEKHTYSVLSSITVTPFHRLIRQPGCLVLSTLPGECFLLSGAVLSQSSRLLAECETSQAAYTLPSKQNFYDLPIIRYDYRPNPAGRLGGGASCCLAWMLLIKLLRQRVDNDLVTDG